jgi:hypothetical protein
MLLVKGGMSSGILFPISFDDIAGQARRSSPQSLRLLRLLSSRGTAAHLLENRSRNWNGRFDFCFGLVIWRFSDELRHCDGGS